MISGSDLFSLNGKIVLVAGGTRGIGRAITLRFARAGATVIANYQRNEEAADAVRKVAVEEQLRVVLCRADLTTDKGLEEVDRAMHEAGPELSGVAYCAATGVHRSLKELTDRHFDWTFNLNVRAFFKLVKLCEGRLTKGSSVVALSSWGAQRALPYYSLVGASKGALEALARHLAAELAPRGIRVNILTAGAVLTDVWKSLPDAENRIATTAARTPAGRLVTPDEVACAAQFLCSDASTGIFGHTLVVDGGAGIAV